MTTGKLKMTELVAAQAIPETTVNEKDRILEAFSSFVAIESNGLSSPPASCSDGACYIVAASPTGLWTSKSGQVAIAVGPNASNGWRFVPPFDGMGVWYKATNIFRIYDGGTYLDPSAPALDAALAALAALEIDDLADVDASAPDAGDVLTWDGFDWVAAPAPGSGGGTGGTVPAGGVKGQALIKSSSVDNDTAWGGAGELEFDPPTLAILPTERKTATAFTASASDVTGKGFMLSLNPTGSGEKAIARLKSAPSAPFQIDVRYRHTPHNTTGDLGIILNNSTNGRSLRLLQLSTGAYYSQSYSSLEVFNATIASNTTSVAADNAGWLRLTVDGSGNVAFFYSRDGAFFKPLGTTTLATYLTASGGSLDEVGVFARANGNGGTSGATFMYYRES